MLTVDSSEPSDKALKAHVDPPTALEPAGPEASVPEGFRGLPKVDADKCTLCGTCASECPSWAIEVVQEGEIARRVFHVDRCIFCGRCAEVCPEGAIEMSTEFDLAHYATEEPSYVVEARVAQCEYCGRPFVVPKHLDAVERLLEEKLDPSIRELVLRDYERYKKLCPDCRRKRAEEEFYPGKYEIGGDGR